MTTNVEMDLLGGMYIQMSMGIASDFSFVLSKFSALNMDSFSIVRRTVFND